MRRRVIQALKQWYDHEQAYRINDRLARKRELKTIFDRASK